MITKKVRQIFCCFHCLWKDTYHEVFEDEDDGNFSASIRTIGKLSTIPFDASLYATPKLPLPASSTGTGMSVGDPAIATSTATAESDRRMSAPHQVVMGAGTPHTSGRSTASAITAADTPAVTAAPVLDERAKEVALLVRGIQGDQSALALLPKGKISSNGVKFVFDKFGNGKTGIESVARALGAAAGMTSIEFGCNNLGSAGVEILCKNLEVKKGITSLAIWGNSVNDKSLQNISKLVKEEKLLKRLVLSNNEITDDGVAYLSSVIPNCISLKALDLSVNSAIRGRGISILCQVLADSPNVKLETLLLANDSLDNDGASAIAKYLSAPACSLVSIDLSYNSIDDNGGILIANAIRNCGSIADINMSGCPFTKKGVAAMRKAAAGSPRNCKLVIQDILD